MSTQGSASAWVSLNRCEVLRPHGASAESRPCRSRRWPTAVRASAPPRPLRDL